MARSLSLRPRDSQLPWTREVISRSARFFPAAHFWAEPPQRNVPGGGSPPGTPLSVARPGTIDFHEVASIALGP